MILLTLILQLLTLNLVTEISVTNIDSITKNQAGSLIVNELQKAAVSNEEFVFTSSPEKFELKTTNEIISEVPCDPPLIQLYDELDIPIPCTATTYDIIFTEILPNVVDQTLLNIKNESKTILADIKLELDIKNRIIAIPRFRIAMVKSGLNQPNAQLLINKIIKNRDVSKLVLLENAIPEINIEIAQEARSERVSQKERNMKTGSRAIALMGVINEDNALDQIKINSLLSNATLKNIEYALRTGSLLTAKALINALDETTVYMTILQKQEILNSF